MKIIQLVPTFHYGDAVGNDTIAIYNILKREGFNSFIYAENIDSRLKDIAKPFNTIEKVDEDDIIVYHMAIGSMLVDWIGLQKCKKVMIYHNITPPYFYSKYSSIVASLCRYGLAQVEKSKKIFDYIIADSEFNKTNLLSMGYYQKIDVIPILIPFGDYKKTPAKQILNKKGKGTVVTFIGRIAPNKKIEDVVTAFYYYKLFYDKDAVLNIVGSFSNEDAYYLRLQEYVSRLDIKDIHFTGHIRFDEILGYYSIADIFLCLSEHEGFCVPIVEAMLFDIPIIAYDYCAVGETLGNGLKIKEKNFLEIAGLMNYVMKDDDLKKTILINQRERLKDFDNEVISKQIIGFFKEITK